MSTTRYSVRATPRISAIPEMVWHDAELALTVVRHSYDRWLVAGHDDTPSLVAMHAYHTHEALHEAARALPTLIDTFSAEAPAVITTRRGTPQ